MVRLTERFARSGRRRWLLGIVLAIAWAQVAWTETSATLAVPGTAQRLDLAIPAPASMEPSPEVRWFLEEKGGDGVRRAVDLARAVGSDGLPGDGYTLLTAIPPAPETSGARRRFQLTSSSAETHENTAGFRIQRDSPGSLRIRDEGQDVLVYNFGAKTEASVPEDDHRRTRACYVHPLYGIRGEELTADFPRDHYHHHGVFWTWPHVTIDDVEHDLWAGDTIQQRFVQWLDRSAGDVAATVGVENGWFVDGEKVMIERVWLRCFRVADSRRAVDIRLTFVPLKPITLRGADGKGYGGFTLRFSPPPGKQNPKTTITLPGGVAEADTLGSRLEWADFTSTLDGGESLSGAAIFIHPDYPDYPPLWLCRHYGALCVGYPGMESMTFDPGQPLTLRQRIWIHDGAVRQSEIDDAWSAYRQGLHAAWE